MAKYQNVINNAQAKLEIIMADPVEFISKLKVINKKGKLVYLNPTEEQIKIIQSLQGGKDTLILKPRQIGSSTIISAYFFWKLFISKEPITIAILSHKLSSAKHLLDIYKRFYLNLPDPVKGLNPINIDNSTEFRFATGAGVIAAASGDKGGLRSFSISALHISEYAFADNPEELKATAISALNDGQLIIESTANFFNDALHKEIIRYQRGLAEWEYLFFPWFDHRDYKMPIPPKHNFEITEEEQTLKDLHDLTNQQIWWRRKRIEKIGYDKFTREFPTSLEEAYRQLGDSYINFQALKDLQIIAVDAVEWICFEDPKPDDRYALGVDVAAGVNRDYSVIQIISKLSGQQVAVYRSNTISPTALAEVILDLSIAFNDALALIESNNHGNVVINELKHLGFRRFWKNEEGKDWITTAQSKTSMFENLKESLRSGKIYRLDSITLSELRSFQIDEKNRVIIPDSLDSHGDSGVALALAYICLEGVRVPKETYLPPFIKERRTSVIKSKKGASVATHRRY